MARLHGQCFARCWSREDFTRFIADANCSSALIRGNEPGQLSAMAVARQVDHEAELLTLAVSPNHRRCGLAVQVMNMLLAKLGENGVQMLFLEVSEHNGAAIALYRKLGATVCGQRHGYYAGSDGAPAAAALTMSLQLEPWLECRTC